MTFGKPFEPGALCKSCSNDRNELNDRENEDEHLHVVCQC